MTDEFKDEATARLRQQILQRPGLRETDSVDLEDETFEGSRRRWWLHAMSCSGGESWSCHRQKRNGRTGG